VEPGDVVGRWNTGRMDPILALLLGLALGVALGVVIGVLVSRARRSTTASDADPRVVEARHAAVVAELRQQEAGARAEVEARLAATQASLEGLRDQLGAAQEQYRELIERGRFDAKQREEADKAESKVLQALAPVKETLSSMQLKVTELETQRSQQHGELAQQLKTATESEERLRATAESLASALRNNATRGVWGETQLRNVVQAAGLIERVDFDVQHSVSSDAGAGRPDMVIHLPGGKNIAVDAKVPFAAYLEASQISVTATGEEGARREALIKQHVKVLRGHIDTLASKAYWAGLAASPELVIAFIPSESLVSSAMEADPSIMDYAFNKRVALASPVTLWSVLKTVAFSWQQDVLTDQAKTLFDLSKELYSRLATLSEHADKLRRSIDATVNSYNQFANSLETRVLVTARKLNALDESKVIGTATTIETGAKQLTAVEMELASLDELEGVHRPELELPDLPPKAGKKSA
jgi:DNA recombination protein RmuC